MSEFIITKTIDAVPKVNKNLVEVVRCKNCKWWNQPFCDKHFDAYIRKADWFCADGEVATVKDKDSKDSGDVK